MKRIFSLIVFSFCLTEVIYPQIFNNTDSVKQGITLKEITITSFKFNKKIDNISLPFELIPQEKIITSPAVTIADLIKDQPGISIERDGIWATTVAIRGFSRSNLVTLADGNRIETATDLSAGLSLINMDDVERIEVIKGASSVLYGTGAVGGVINIFSKTSGYSDDLFVKGSLISSYNGVNKQGTGSIIVNAGTNNWYAKLFQSMRSAQNTKTPQGELPNSQFRDRAFSALVGFKPQNNQEVIFNYQKFNASDVGIPGGSTLFPSSALVKYTEANREMFSGEYKILNFSKALNIFKVKYYFQNIDRYVENIPYQQQYVPAQSGSPAKNVYVLKITPNARHYTQGVQLQTDWNIAPDNYLIAGTDIWQRKLDSKREKYQKIEVLNASNAVISTTNKIIGERPVPESDFRNIGFYADDEIKLFEKKIILNLGARFDAIRVSNQKTFNPVYEITNGIINFTPSTQALNWDSKEVNDYSWSGSLSTIYFCSNKINLTMNLSRSFRAASLEERYQYIDLGNVLRIGDPELKPEDGFFADFGIKFHHEKLNLNFNVFGNFISNMIVEVPGTYMGRAAYIKRNSDKARLLGFDFNGKYNFNNNINLYCIASYVNGRDTEKDSALPQIPPLNGKIGISTSVIDLFNADLSASVFADQDEVASGEIKTPGYVFYNLYLSSFPVNCGFADILINTGVENIFDKNYRNHLSSNRGFVLSEPGRNIFVKLQLNW